MLSKESGEQLQEFGAQAHGLSNVVLPGWITPDEIGALMQMAKIGLAPYARQYGVGTASTQGNRAAEYMAGGLLIVSRSGLELEKILKEEGCGLTYEADDVEGLHCIRFLVDHPSERDRMGRNSYRIFHERFSAEHVYTAMIDQLERIAAHQHASSRSRRQGL